ncbi:MAG: beta-propeller domain-containing protein [Clostridia bacterium]|nr:beta-propeller domain-containing protein [Clostridia bacterium]
MFNEKENNGILRDALGKEITLPESLSKENIVKLIESENASSKRKQKGVLRRFIAVGVAACLMITGVSFLLDKGLFGAPESLIEDENVQNQAAQDTAESYDELLSFIKEYAGEYKKNNKYHTYLYSGLVDGTADDMEGVKTEESADIPVAGLPVPGLTFNGSVSFSAEESTALRGEFGEVNLREHGVREADIFITDGEYLYCIDTWGRRLRIIKANDDGTLESVYEGEESHIDDKGTGDQIYYSGLYVYQNYLIVGFTRHILDKHYTKSGVSGVQIYDVSDRSAPVLKKEIALDGTYISSRIIDSSLVLVTKYSIIEQYETENDVDLLPAVYNGDYKYSVPCDCIVYSREDNPETYVNIGKIDLGSLDNELVVSSYLGSVHDTYCTRDTLYVIGSKIKDNNGTDDGRFIGFGGVMIRTEDMCTTVTKADISGEKVDIKCRTEFSGSILNDYSIDEYNKYLRVAVTTLDNENSIYVFDENLGKVGELTGLADGEQIKSARFMGNTAYVVTFVQTDPLFVIDLTDPVKPEIKGEVKLPGFSSYLHPAGDGLLVGIGVGGTETGTDGSSKISLFDVSDPASPKEIDHLQYPTSHIGTEAKAFCSISEGSFLVTYSNWGENVFDSEKHYYKHYTGALKVSVKDNKLVLDNAYILKGGDSVDRVTFIRDNVFVFSAGEAGVASFNMETGGFIDIAEMEDARYSFAASDRPASDILY